MIKLLFVNLYIIFPSGIVTDQTRRRVQGFAGEIPRRENADTHSSPWTAADQTGAGNAEF